MDNKDYEELEDETLEDEELIDDEIENDELEEIPDSSLEEADDSEYYENFSDDYYEDSYQDAFNNQKIKENLRNLTNKNKQNQNAIERLNKRKANTISKGVEAPESTPSTSNIPKPDVTKNMANPLNKGLGSLKDAGKTIGKEAGKKAGQAAATAGKALAQGVGSLLKVLVTNPYFWLIVGVILLLILIPLLWQAHNGDDSSGSGSKNGYFDEECDFNLTKVNLKLHDGTIVATNLNFEDYILGVAYAEIGDGIYTDGLEEYAKTEIVIAKTYSLTVGNYDSNTKTITLKSSTAHHAWCDIYKGCDFYPSAGVHWYYPKESGISKSGATTYKSALNEEYIKKAKETYKQVENYIYAPNKLKENLTKSSQLKITEYRDHTQLFWKKLALDGKKLEDILEATSTTEYPSYVKVLRPTETLQHSTADTIMNQYKDKSLYNLSSYCDYTAVAGNCTTSTPIKIGENEKFNVTSPFGMRIHPITGKPKMHNGIDLAYAGGTPIYSIADGTVVAEGFDSGAGNYVNIGHDLDGDGTYDYTTYNYHMINRTTLKVGEKVTGGQQVGSVGTTGSSTGNHLHFGISDVNGKYIDPKPIIDALKTKTSVFDNNSTCEDSKNSEENSEENEEELDVPSGAVDNTKVGKYYYNQYDYRHIKYCPGYSDGATIKTSGCFVGSMTTALANLYNKNVSVANMADYICTNKKQFRPQGSGTDSNLIYDKDFSKKYKFKAKTMTDRSADNIYKTIRKGYKIVVSVRCGHFNPSCGGHYIEIDAAKDGKIYVYDPGRRERNGWYTKTQITNYITNRVNTGMWAISLNG